MAYVSETVDPKNPRNMIKGIPEGARLRYIPLPSSFSTDELKVHYLFGIEMASPENDPFPEQIYIHHLDAAIRRAEVTFNITIGEQTITDEQHDFHGSDYQNWGFIQLWKAPVLEVTKLQLLYGSQPSFTIPNDWIKLEKQTGIVNLFPSAGSAGSLIITGSGALLGIQNRWGYAPQMWSVDYKCGMEAPTQEKPFGPTVVDSALYDCIYMWACINVMDVWGDLILGAGIASQSIGIDGLSQSISSTQSAMFAGASGRCEEYRKALETLVPTLKQKYTGIRMVVV